MKRKAKPDGQEAPEKPVKVGSVERMLRAATLIVTEGLGMPEVARRLRVSADSIRDLVREHPETWELCRREAKARIVNRTVERHALIQSVRTAARSLKMPRDMREFLRAAKLAEQVAESEGVELFPAPADGSMNLTRFFREWFIPMRLNEDGNTATRVSYEATLSRWRVLTGDPPLKEITSATLAKFRDCLLKIETRRGPISPVTVARHLRHVGILLAKAGPPGPRNRDAAGIIPVVPYVKAPRVVAPLPRIVAEADIEAIYRAAVSMKRPGGADCPPGDWWQVFIATAWGTGLRLGTLLVLRWEWIDLDEGLIRIPPEALKGRRWLVMPINATVRLHLQRIRRKKGPVFPWPFEQNAFYQMWRDLLDLAGIPADRRFGVHNIRKTLATKLWAIAPKAAVLALGHAASDTTLRHYVQGTGIVASALNKLVPPAAFTAGTLSREEDSKCETAS